MKLFPYERLKFETRLTQAEVLNRLNKVVEPRKWIRITYSNHKPYQGSVTEEGFKISPIESFSRGLLPVINGTLENRAMGNTVVVKMRLSIVMIFIVLLLVYSLLSFLFTEIMAAISDVNSISPDMMSGYIGILIFGGITVANYVFVLLMFSARTKKVKEHFQKLFEAYDVEETGFILPFNKGFD